MFYRIFFRNSALANNVHFYIFLFLFLLMIVSIENFTLTVLIVSRETDYKMEKRMKAEKKIIATIIILIIIYYSISFIVGKFEIHLLSNYRKEIILSIWFIIISLLFINESNKKEFEIQKIKTEYSVKDTFQKENFEKEKLALTGEIEFLKNKNNTQEKFLNDEYKRKLNEYIEKNKNYANISEEFKSFSNHIIQQYVNELKQNNFEKYIEEMILLNSKINSFQKFQFSDVYNLTNGSIEFIKNRDKIEIYSNNINFIESYMNCGKFNSINSNEEMENELFNSISKLNNLESELNIIENKINFNFIIVNNAELIIPFGNEYLYFYNIDLINKIYVCMISKRKFSFSKIKEILEKNNYNLPF